MTVLITLKLLEIHQSPALDVIDTGQHPGRAS